MTTAQANIFVPKYAEPFWEQTRRWNHQASLGIAASLGVVAGLCALAFGSMYLWLIAGAMFGWMILIEPRLGLYLSVAATSIDAASYDPLTASLERLYLVIPGLPITPIQLLVFWSCVAWGVKSSLSGEWHLPNKTVLGASLLFAALIPVSILNGLNHGASLNIAIWESRDLILILPLLLLTNGLITSRRHVFEFVGLYCIALTLMSLELAWRYLSLVRTGQSVGAIEAAFNHDGAVLVGFLAVLGSAGIMWSTEKKLRLASFAATMLAILVVLASRRRAAVIGMEAGFVVLALVLAATNWRRFLLVGSVALVVGSMYMGAFWNSNNSLGQPARAIRSAISPASQSDRDKSSDDYRNIEKLNLWFDIKASPLSGIGFGVAYAKPFPLTDLSKSWPLWAYIPHNNILWLWLKGGIGLFIAFWFLVGAGVTQAMNKARTTKNPILTAILASVCAYFVMCVVFAYVDIGLSSTRLMIVFGACLGLISALERLWPSTTQTVDAGG